MSTETVSASSSSSAPAYTPVTSRAARRRHRNAKLQSDGEEVKVPKIPASEVVGTPEYAEARRARQGRGSTKPSGESKDSKSHGPTERSTATATSAASGSSTSDNSSGHVSGGADGRDDGEFVWLTDVRGGTFKVRKSSIEAAAKDDKGVKSDKGRTPHDARSRQTQRGNGSAWHPITGAYGPWCDDMGRLSYIFDRRGMFTDIYDQYGKDGDVENTMIEPHVSYPERKQILKAKKCFDMREEWLNAFCNTPEVTHFRELVQSSVVDHGILGNPVAEDSDPSNETLLESERASELIPEELNAFMLWTVSEPITTFHPSDKNDLKTGGFVLRDAASGNIIEVWRQGDRNVLLRLHRNTSGDSVAHSTQPISLVNSILYDDGSDPNHEVVDDRKEIFTFLDSDTAIMHEVFHAKTRLQLIEALTKFIAKGWMVIPQSC